MTAQTVAFRDPLRKQALACGALIAVSIAIAAWGKPAGEVQRFAAAPATAAVSLRFEDAADGAVVAREAGTGAELGRFAIGEGGFVRVALRSFAATRGKQNVGPDAPFVLSRLQSGALVLRDPATGRIVLLDAFGETNAGAFAVLLDKPENGHGRNG